MQIHLVNDQQILRTFMKANPGETTYALGDLEPHTWPDSSYWGAFEQDVLRGFVLVYTGFPTPVLTMHGNPDAVQAVLGTMQLPHDVFCLVPHQFQSQLEHYYAGQYLYLLWRMVVDPSTYHSPDMPLTRGAEIVRLQSDDAERLNTFYQQAADPGEEVMAFSPSQVGTGVFFVVQQDGEWVAAAGTHVVSQNEGVAAVGNIFTAPPHRGHGLGTHVTAAVTEQLIADGIKTIALNVKQTNAPAIHVYQKLGYQKVMRFIEGPAYLKSFKKL